MTDFDGKIDAEVEQLRRIGFRMERSSSDGIELCKDYGSYHLNMKYSSSDNSWKSSVYEKNCGVSRKSFESRSHANADDALKEGNENA